MVKEKHAHFPTKKKPKVKMPLSTEEDINPDIEREIGLRKIKISETHHKGHCKICHKDVKNLEVHNRIKHKELKR